MHAPLQPMLAMDAFALFFQVIALAAMALVLFVLGAAPAYLRRWMFAGFRRGTQTGTALTLSAAIGVFLLYASAPRTGTELLAGVERHVGTGAQLARLLALGFILEAGMLSATAVWDRLA